MSSEKRLQKAALQTAEKKKKKKKRSLLLCPSALKQFLCLLDENLLTAGGTSREPYEGFTLEVRKLKQEVDVGPSGASGNVSCVLICSPSPDRLICLCVFDVSIQNFSQTSR